MNAYPCTIHLASYDGDGKRRSYHDSGGLRDLLWDAENVMREYDGAALVAAYTHSPQVYGLLVSQRRGGATSFHHYDALGSTERLTDASQNAVVSYLYRAFGVQSVLSGSSANPFTWVGRLGYYRQPDASDYWLRARTYSPAASRFLSRDPIRQPNRYMYAGNSPVLSVDPSGLREEDVYDCPGQEGLWLCQTGGSLLQWLRALGREWKYVSLQDESVSCRCRKQGDPCWTVHKVRVSDPRKEGGTIIRESRGRCFPATVCVDEEAMESLGKVFAKRIGAQLLAIKYGKEAVRNWSMFVRMIEAPLAIRKIPDSPQWQDCKNEVNAWMKPGAEHDWTAFMNVCYDCCRAIAKAFCAGTDHFQCYGACNEAWDLWEHRGA